MPQILRTTHDCKVIPLPLVAVQVTVLPNHGIAVGLTAHHSVADAKKSIIKDPCGVEEIFWSEMQGILELFAKFGSEAPRFNKVRATYVLAPIDIERLKNKVLKLRGSESARVTTFTVTCVYMWTCMLKSKDTISEELPDEENELEYFSFTADCRALLTALAPANYFGKCLAPCLAKARHGELVRSEGFLVTSPAIGEAIEKRVHNKGGVLADVKTWLSESRGIPSERLLGISGSPKFDSYGVDFGWGKPAKFEIASIDYAGLMSLIKSRKFEGGVEIGLSLPKIQMDAFARIFEEGVSLLSFS